MLASYDLLQRYQFSSKEAIRLFLRSGCGCPRVWYYPGHLSLADEKHVSIFDVLSRENVDHGPMDPLNLSVLDATPIDLIHWKAVDTYIVVFSNGALLACFFDSSVSRWVVSAELSLVGHRTGVTVLSVALVPDANSLVWCEKKQQLQSLMNGDRCSLYRTNIHVQTNDSPTVEVMSITVTCGAPILCIDDCPPCDLHLAVNNLVVWPRTSYCAGIYFVMSPMLTAVSVCVVGACNVSGAVFRQDVLTSPASYVDLAARSAWLWMQLAGGVMASVSCLLVAADTCLLYAVTETGALYGFSKDAEVMSLLRVTLPSWALGSLASARITGGFMLVAWDGEIRTIDLTSGVTSAVSLSPIKDRIICSWQSPGDLPSVGFCNSKSVYCIQNGAELSVTSTASTVALKLLLEKSSGIYKQNEDETLSTKIAFDKLLNTDGVVSQLAAALQSPALLISLLHRAKTDYQEYYVQLLVRLRALMTSRQSVAPVTELEELLYPFVQEYWSMEEKHTVLHHGNISGQGSIKRQSISYGSGATQPMQRDTKKVHVTFQHVAQVVADSYGGDSASVMRLQQLSVCHPEAVLVAIQNVFNLRCTCAVHPGGPSNSGCDQQIWSPFLCEPSIKQPSNRWLWEQQPDIFATVAQLIYKYEPHLLMCAWPALDQVGKTRGWSRTGSGSMQILAASLPDPSCTRCPYDAACAKAALLLKSGAVDSCVRVANLAAAVSLLLRFEAVDEAVRLLETVTSADTCKEHDSGRLNTTMHYWQLVSSVLRTAVHINVLGTHSKRLVQLLPPSFGVKDFFKILKTELFPVCNSYPLVDPASGTLCIADIRNFAVMLQRRGKLK